MSWTGQLVAKPYSRTGQGPDSFNCWALVREGLRLGFGIEVPMLDLDTEEGWRAVNLRARMAREWTVVPGLPQAADILSMVGMRRDLHVALCLDHRLVLHTSQDSGEARIQRTEELRFLGFDRFEIWRRT